MITEDLGYTVKNEPMGNPEEIFIYIEIFNQGEGSYWEKWEKSQFSPSIMQEKHMLGGNGFFARSSCLRLIRCIGGPK